MKDKHLILKCWNCKKWSFYCKDESGCDCGVHCYLPDDILSSNECEIKEISLKKLLGDE